MSAHSGYFNNHMADCKRCGRDIEDLKTITCSKNLVSFEDGEYLPRVPYDDTERSDALFVLSCPVVSITRAAIWKDVQGAGKD